MEYLIFAAAMVCFIVLMMLKSFLDYKKSEKRFVQKLYKEYGTLPQKEYKPEQFENISHYFLKHKEGYYVDDITWNDLNMDEIFKQLNNTFSSAGEEYLYHILRTPCLEEEELLVLRQYYAEQVNHVLPAAVQLPAYQQSGKSEGRDLAFLV